MAPQISCSETEHIKAVYTCILNIGIESNLSNSSVTDFDLL